MSQIYEYFDVTGGGQTLSGYAFPEVHKFDASAFYNWEQDNLPVLDLETRSNVLRQYLGLTDVSGVTLTVSSDAPKSASSLGVYQTVQDALEVVPRRLRFPLLIEICDFGNLGDLTIADIHCEGNGALQIEGRQFSDAVTLTVADTVSAGNYGPSATQTLPLTVSSTNLKNGFQNASSTNLALNCASVEGWDRYSRTFVTRTPDSQTQTQALLFKPQPSTDTFVIGGAFGNRYNVSAYGTREESTVALDPDPRTSNGSGESLLTARDALEANDNVSVAAWGTHFNKIEIKNCSRVKLKNICVDSASGSDNKFPNTLVYLCDTGLDVKNSNILLENFAATRFRKSGISLQNSTASVAGNFIVYRIYERNRDETKGKEGAGVYCVDSSLAFDTSAGDGTELRGHRIRALSKCGVGLHAINSTITGGAVSTGTVKNAGSIDTDTFRLYIHSNTTGVKLVNCVYDVDGRTSVFCNIRGFDCAQSTLRFQQFSVDYNQEEGFYLDNTNLIYGKDAATLETGVSGTVARAFTCDYNGINLHVDKNSSVGYPADLQYVPTLDMWGGTTTANWAITNHGATDIDSFKSPSILVSQNSNAELVNLSVAGDARATGVPGACVQARSNSNVTLRGTSKSHTILGSLGSVILKKNWTTAAAGAIENSQITFTGPTKISRFGIGVLAQNNSKVSFVPPSVEYNHFVPAKTRFQLSSTANHTRLDVHANRACLVANDRSTIQMQSLGGNSLDPDNSINSSQSYDFSSTFAECTSGSFVRFCPNGFTEQLESSFYTAANFDQFTRTTDGLADQDHNINTTGGMCVRAVGSSKVDVDLVNFKVEGELQSDVSGVCYNYNGTGCEYDGEAFSGTTASPTSNLCDLVTSCCDPIPTTTVSTTTTDTTSITESTVTASTVATTSSTIIQPPTLTWEGQDMADPFDVDGLDDFAESERGSGRAGRVGLSYSTSGDIEFSCVGSRIHMWNIADTSRLNVANVLLNGVDPLQACVADTFHGPTGRWFNGAACDYYGRFGFAASALGANGLGTPVGGFYNLGVYRIVGSHRSYLKTYTEVDYDGFPIQSQMVGGGSPMDQVNCQGYQTMFDAAINTDGAEDEVAFHVGLEPGLTSGTEPVFGRGLAGLPGEPGKMNGVITHARMNEGRGMLWDEGELHPAFPVPPLHVDWQGYLRIWVDESAASLFANARHAANKKVNLLSIYRSSTSSAIGGEGRDATTGNPTFGVGVRSLNMFDLNSLV